ncbi:hypothetical protein [Paenibacillus bovis]|uniref:Uncharacterized protein n=1 Tax=Paenibacillus bovis TaxID=1616788 RepID=A0A172ZGH0_9BACL|nr:hypothetical protein [Paenibacillus bovis]ANF96629.1 hypothetical protein AR543_11835 [Paenibacillus bovis]
MSKNDIKMQLQPTIDLADYIAGYTIQSVLLGPDQRIFVLLIDQIPDRIRGMFVQASLDKPRTYKILIIEDGQIQEVILANQKFHYHTVQPLEDHLLLVGARCHYYGPDQYDLNARVCDMDGHILHDFLLGDGIEYVQVTREGTIWTGYFDEGVFGNYGWNPPVGEAGLLAWDAQGNRLYTNTQADIMDCYALNVINDQEVWFYYYTDFMLGHITGGTTDPQIEWVNPQISGSSGFCTDGYHFLFQGGYNNSNQLFFKKRDQPGRLTGKKTVQLQGANQQPLDLTYSDFRRDQILIYSEGMLYTTAIQDILHVL